ncbi:hypothetical protein V5F49_19230 [Xanthobacter sp. V3C-3]|uniref:hypothetical protein n=1 Tax=Xanthobacter lutulentifluminis TaxID=3119935 RepID=UPI00372B54A8
MTDLILHPTFGDREVDMAIERLRDLGARHARGFLMEVIALGRDGCPDTWNDLMTDHLVSVQAQLECAGASDKSDKHWPLALSLMMSIFEQAFARAVIQSVAASDLANIEPAGHA